MKPFVMQSKIFTPEELTEIIEFGDMMIDAGFVDIVKGNVPGKRKCEIARIQPAKNTTAWIYERLHHAVTRVNRQEYRFAAASGFNESIQYARYTDASYFDWHIDMRPGTPAPRKLSAILLLSDPKEYEGGLLEFFCETDPVDWMKGDLIVFPSWALHKVSTVTAGTRRTLTAWASGPDFT